MRSRFAHRPALLQAAVIRTLTLLASWISAILLTTGGSASASSLSAKVVSSRPEWVTGTDAVLEISGASSAAVFRVTVNGVVARTTARPNLQDGRFRLLVQGLVLGENVLQVTDTAGRSVQLRLVSHPSSGPLLSGWRITPYDCQTEASGLGPPQDAECRVPTQIDYFYKTTGGAFRPLPQAAELPSDLAVTQTSEGQTAPYIVRVESGVINRSIYRIAMLEGRGRLPGTWTPGGGWNRRLVVAFGGGCGAHYASGFNSITDALSDLELSRGFAYAISTALVNQQFCNPAIQGETLMMLKEHFAKSYDVPRWTVGAGESGGAIQQFVIAQMYPGLLDGLQTIASFPDAQWQAALDCSLLQHAFDKDPARWTDAKTAAVRGASLQTCTEWIRSFADMVKAVPRVNPGYERDNRPCGVSDPAQLFDRQHNPQGLRCSVWDFQANFLGRGPDGRARVPFDNEGVQYGLLALTRREITVDDFLALNAAVGGLDEDGEHVSRRSKADPRALENLYASGLLNTGAGGLSTVPIISQRVYVDRVPPGSFAALHDRAQDFIIRQRLLDANGSSANHVIFTHAGNADTKTRSLEVMTAWLDRITADAAPLTMGKVLGAKPNQARDTCYSPQGLPLIEVASYAAASRCNGWYPPHGEPRMVAGGPLANDVAKCRLRPIRGADFGAKFTAAQKTRLRQIFPLGVCDFTKPGVAQRTIVATYQNLGGPKGAAGPHRAREPQEHVPQSR